MSSLENMGFGSVGGLRFLEVVEVDSEDVRVWLESNLPANELPVFTVAPVAAATGSSLWMVAGYRGGRAWEQISVSVLSEPDWTPPDPEPEPEPELFDPPVGGPFKLVDVWHFKGADNLNDWDIHNGPTWDNKWDRAVDAVTIRDSKLSIAASIIGGRRTSGGATLPVSQIYGRFSFRARTTTKSTAQPRVRLWPDPWQNWPAGGDVLMMGADDAVGIALASNGGATSHVVAAAVDVWRTFVTEWTPSGVRARVDDGEWFDLGVVPVGPMNIAVELGLNDVVDGGGAPGPLPTAFEIDWIQIEEYEGVTQPPPPPPEPDPEPVTSGLAHTNPLRFTPMKDLEHADPNSIKANDVTVYSEPAVGSHPHGNHRLFAYPAGYKRIDPLVMPGMEGMSHAHMFFGNTNVNANSTGQTLLASGNGTTQAGAGNRSAYWVPAMLDGAGLAVPPDRILLYYKSRNPTLVQQIPPGLSLLAGNLRSENGKPVVGDALPGTYSAQWGFYNDAGGVIEPGWITVNGAHVSTLSRIPQVNKNGRKYLMSVLQFPQFIERDGNGMRLDSGDHLSHATIVEHGKDGGLPGKIEVAQLSMLMFWRWDDEVAGWGLASDKPGFLPGHSLHGDVIFAWAPQVQQAWFEGCMAAAKNCSLGQIGGHRIFTRLTGADVSNFSYEGPRVRLQV